MYNSPKTAALIKLAYIGIKKINFTPQDRAILLVSASSLPFAGKSVGIKERNTSQRCVLLPKTQKDLFYILPYGFSFEQKRDCLQTTVLVRSDIVEKPWAIFITYVTNPDEFHVETVTYWILMVSYTIYKLLSMCNGTFPTELAEFCHFCYDNSCVTGSDFKGFSSVF